MSHIYALTNNVWVKRIAVLASIITLSIVFSMPFQASAQGERARELTGLTEFEEDLELGKKDLRETVADIINAALGLLGIVAVVIVVIGGFLWMTAGGSGEQVEKAKGWIFSGIIGLAIILSAYAITRFVISELGVATDLGVG